MSVSARPNSAGSPCCRAEPWWTTTCRSGAKRRVSASQLWTTLSGQTTRCGPGRSRRWASVVAVLPRPMSSARQPPRPTRARNCIHPARGVGSAAARRGTATTRRPPPTDRRAARRAATPPSPAAPSPSSGPSAAGAMPTSIGTSPSPSPPADRRSSSTGPTRARCARCASSSVRARRSPAGSIRTQRWPVRSRLVPAASTRARSASDSGVPSTTASQSTSASLLKCPLRSSVGASRAVPRTPKA